MNSIYKHISWHSGRCVGMLSYVKAALADPVEVLKYE